MINSAAPGRGRRRGLAAALLPTLALLAFPSLAAASTLGLTATDATIGGTIQASAQLADAPDAAGTISFEVFGPDDPTCQGPAFAEPAAAAVSGEGNYPSGTFTPTVAGSYRWSAHFAGDPVNADADAECVALSTVSKAAPQLLGTATSVPRVGLQITDSVVVSSGFEPSGKLVFRAFGPGDPTCSNPPAAEEEIDLNGNGTYVSDPFEPATAGLYLWTVSYAGDANNLGASTPCGAANQASAVGTIDVTLIASAGNNTVGGALTATATLGNGAIPGGQLTFRAFAPGDTGCAGAAAFTSTVAVKGNGTYGSAAFAPGQVGTYRWTVAYSGDVNHAATATACGAASSAVAKANPTIAGRVGKKLTVGTRFRDTATLAGGFSPGGTITFEIYLPGANRCDRPNFVNTVTVNGNGTYRSDPFVAKRAGRYRFVARYSGDASNQAATDACSSPEQLAQVRKRTPKLRPRALLVGAQQISIRASLAGASSPTGVLSFRLFAPGDRRCTGRPAFAGSLRVRENGTFTLAEYIATEPGVYRLGLAYSGDPRNAKAKLSCAGTQPIAVRG